MRKPVVTYFDPRSGVSYRLNRATGVVATRDGEYPDDETAARVRQAVAARDRSAAARRERDSVMRSLGMIKVRGNLGGTYWE